MNSSDAILKLQEYHLVSAAVLREIEDLREQVKKQAGETKKYKALFYEAGDKGNFDIRKDFLECGDCECCKDRVYEYNDSDYESQTDTIQCYKYWHEELFPYKNPLRCDECILKGRQEKEYEK